MTGEPSFDDRLRRAWGQAPAANLALENLDWATTDEPTVEAAERQLAATMAVALAVLQLAWEMRTMPTPPGYYGVAT